MVSKTSPKKSTVLLILNLGTRLNKADWQHITLRLLNNNINWILCILCWKMTQSLLSCLKHVTFNRQFYFSVSLTSSRTVATSPRQ